MTRTQLARKQVKARQKGNMGLFFFLMAIGGFMLSGQTILSQASKMGHSLKSQLKNLSGEKVFKELGRQVTKDDIQFVVEAMDKNTNDRD